MRLGVIPENFIERIVLKKHKVPEPLLETQMAFSMARSIMVGVKLGLFEAVGDGARTAAEISKTCHTSPGATEKLLNTLVGCGYLTVHNGSHAATPKTEKWLLRRSSQNLCDKMLFQFYEWDAVENYEELCEAGSPWPRTPGFRTATSGRATSSACAISRDLRLAKSPADSLCPPVRGTCWISMDPTAILGVSLPQAY